MMKSWPRILGIGACHLALYGYLVPFVLYPRFGNGGTAFATALAVAISIAILGTAWFAKKKK